MIVKSTRIDQINHRIVLSTEEVKQALLDTALKRLEIHPEAKHVKKTVEIREWKDGLGYTRGYEATIDVVVDFEAMPKAGPSGS